VIGGEFADVPDDMLADQLPGGGHDVIDGASPVMPA